jgi:putative inorganic carbon (HCO3(-)) transporter
MRAILVAVLLSAAVSLLNYRAGVLRIHGLFANANAMGEFMLLGVGSLIAGRAFESNRIVRLAFLAGILAAILCLLLTWSRASWSAGVIFLVVALLLMKRKKLLLLLGGAAIVGGLVFVTSDYFATVVGAVGRFQFGTTHRVTLWRFGTASALAHPIFGRGFKLEKGDVRSALPISGLGEALTLKGSELPFNPHNYYVSIALSAGIPGLIIYIVVLFKLFRTQLGAYRLARDGKQRLAAAVLVSLLAGAVFHSFFEIGFLTGSGSYANYFWILLGVVEAARIREMEF